MSPSPRHGWHYPRGVPHSLPLTQNSTFQLLSPDGRMTGCNSSRLSQPPCFPEKPGQPIRSQSFCSRPTRRQELEQFGVNAKEMGEGGGCGGPTANRSWNEPLPSCQSRGRSARPSERSYRDTVFYEPVASNVSSHFLG